MCSSGPFQLPQRAKRSRKYPFFKKLVNELRGSFQLHVPSRDFYRDAGILDWRTLCLQRGSCCLFSIWCRWSFPSELAIDTVQEQTSITFQLTLDTLSLGIFKRFV